MIPQCRLCSTLYESNAEEMLKLNIFADKEINELIFDILALNLIEHNSIPSHVCRVCEETLYKYRQYKLMCIKSQEIFKTKIEQVTAGEGLTNIKEEILDIKLELPENDDNAASDEAGFGDSDVKDDAAAGWFGHSLGPNGAEEAQKVVKKRRKRAKAAQREEEEEEGKSDGVEDCRDEDEDRKDGDPGARSRGRKPGRLSKKRAYKYRGKDVGDPGKVSTCEFCGEQILGWREYKTHQRFCLAPNTICRCRICNKQFKSKTGLKTHFNVVHEKSKQMCCEICGDIFPCKGNLVIHMQTHSGIKYDCDLCSKSYSSTKQLKIHKDSIHFKTLNFQCSMCGMKFHRPDRFKSHLVTHSEEKQYKCHICPKEFHHAKDHKNHLSVHTGVRPFECGYCGKTTRLKDNMYHHLKHHSVRNLPKEEEIIVHKAFLT